MPTWFFLLFHYCAIATFLCACCSAKSKHASNSNNSSSSIINSTTCRRRSLATNRWQKCARYKFMLETSNRRKLRAAWPGLAWPQLQAGGALAVKFLTCLDLQFSNSNAQQRQRQALQTTFKIYWLQQHINSRVLNTTMATATAAATLTWTATTVSSICNTNACLD